MGTTAPIVASRQPVNRLELERFFTGIGSRMVKRDTSLPHDSPRSLVRVSEVEQFFSEVRLKVEPQQCRLDRKWATGFNVFHFIKPDENKLSDVLAWLLDPRGSHGQGGLFLGLMFKRVNLGTGAKLTVDAKVQREAPTFGIEKYRRRMDVLVAAGAWLAIENKVDSPEQPEQVNDYLEDLHRCTASRNLPNTLIYLTPNGRSPEFLHPAMLKKHKKTDGCIAGAINLNLAVG